MSESQHIDQDLSNSVVVLGLGITGLSVVRYLTNKKDLPVVLDSRDQPPAKDELTKDFPQIKYRFGSFDKNILAKAKQLVVSPGISVKTAAIAHAKNCGVEVIGDIEIFARNADAPVIAITGSNGKSTVTTLVGDILRQAGLKVAVGGNIGVPALDLLDKNADVYVLELSSFQLETVQSLKPESAVVLNVSEDHMDRYDSYGDYITAKQRIYSGALHCVINRDDEIVSSMRTAKGSISFGISEPTENDYGLRSINGERWICKGQSKLINSADLQIGGLHNITNVMAALALSDSFELDQEKVIKAVKQFAGLPHRMQRVGVKDGVNWYNDSKATNVGAANAAIAGLHGKVILIAGGESKDADLSLLKEVVEKHVKLLILIGRDADKIEQVCRGITEIVHAVTMNEAVDIASQSAINGDNVLLSPACASFDMFDNYEHRGDVFVAAVREVLK
ncbi:MAG: UDP-N-acetylmuramoyl-L-alanine--D-glutamate ligase [Gammaproteobacteria bacterium]|nr:UDP-N-acetylmuramoyl-L-alanine--D-glutamate ligase [Gammaproteobacteria bacterium]